jgi:D-psicose/D-tagatose/L-ribulose 3-epimerase
VRLAISNIAWDAAEDDAVAALLRQRDVSAVEIAPTKWRADPAASSASERANYRRQWEDRGLRIVAMQALLFGQPQLQLFGELARRVELANYLQRMIELGAALGAGALVFGSPKNRARNGLSMSEALNIATEFFAGVGVHAAAHGTVLCIEANPPAYGCDFITTTAEATELCQRVDSAGVRVNGDLGGMTMSGENVAAEIRCAAPMLQHFHVSEPQLAELGTASDHATAATTLRKNEFAGWISIEMRAGADRLSNMAAIERAVTLTQRLY